MDRTTNQRLVFYVSAVATGFFVICIFDLDHVAKYLLGLCENGRIWHYQSCFLIISLVLSLGYSAFTLRLFTNNIGVAGFGPEGAEGTIKDTLPYSPTSLHDQQNNKLVWDTINVISECNQKNIDTGSSHKAN